MIEQKTAPRIEKIVRVVDTRTFEEIGDRWVPLPGTGTENECGRCGRLHEIHAIVALSDGSESIVGVSCMKAESIELAEKARALAGNAKRLGALRAELRSSIERAAKAERLEDEARAAFVPTFWIETRERRPGLERETYGATFEVLHCGTEEVGASRWLVISKDSPALREELARDARLRASDRALELAGLRSSAYYRELAARARRSIQRLEDKLAGGR